MRKTIYLDYAATTPLDPGVAQKMSEYLTINGTFGNPASNHVYGKKAKEAVEAARSQIASVINATANEIVFTSGATEATNLALKGAAQLYRQRGKHIITLKTEHSATLDTCQWLEKNGYQVTYLSPEPNGVLDLEKFKNALRDDTILVSILHVNNETGVIQDISKIAEITVNRRILLHVDAAQTIGKTRIDLQNTPINLLSMCAHKTYGPKGIGALYVRSKPKIRVAAQIHGGGHEKGMRSGTLATHQIVGMGEAFRVSADEFDKNNIHIKHCRDQFLNLLSQKMTFEINGANTVPHILNIRFQDQDIANAILKSTALAVSAGSACHSKGIEPSHVLRAMGLSFYDAHCSLRFSFGKFTTDTEIKDAVDLIIPSRTN